MYVKIDEWNENMFIVRVECMLVYFGRRNYVVICEMLNMWFKIWNIEEREYFNIDLLYVGI